MQNTSLASNNIVVGIATNISLSSELFIFIEVASILKKLAFGSIQFIIAKDACIGEEECYNQFKNYAIQKLGKSNVIFTKFENIDPPFLLMIDVLMLLTEEESLKNLALKAMAMEVPVVASNNSCFSEIIKHDSTGILVNTKNPQTIAIGVLEFLLKRDKADIIREHAVEYVNKNHDLNLQAEKLQNSYQLLINHKLIPVKIPNI